MSVSSGSMPSKYIVTDFTDPSTPHDRVLVVGEEKTKFYVFAGHLSFCSEFFHTLFIGDFKEKDEIEIELKELNSEDFHFFLKALIPGNNDAVTVDNYLPILACARRFLSNLVLSMCEKFVTSNFATLDKIELLKLAFEYNWDELKTKLSTELVDNVTMFITKDCPRNCTYTARHCYGCGIDYHTDEMISKTSFLVENQKEISALSDAFILKALLKQADQ